MGKYRSLGTFFDRVFRNNLNSNFEDINTDIKSQKQRVDDLITGTPQPSEVVDARGGMPVLRDRLDATDAQLAQIGTEKAEKGEVFLKEIGININDFDDPTRQTFLSAQGIDVNYVLGRENVKPINTSFIKRGNQLFNKTTAIAGKYVKLESGLIADHSNYYASDFIPVTGGQTYYKNDNDIPHFAWYDNQKNYISGGSNGLYPQKVITAPANADFLRVSVPNSAINSYMLSEGSASKPYEEYQEFLEHKFLKDIPIAVYSKNKFNKATITDNAFISGDNGTVITGHGSYGASDYILVKGDSKYTFTNIVAQHFAWFDNNKTFISGFTSLQTMPVTSPSNAAYVRVTLLMSNKDVAQLEEGIVATPYIPYGKFKLNDLTVFEEINKALSEYVPNVTDQVYGDLDIILPRKIYALLGDSTNTEETKVYFRNVIKGNLNLLNVDVDSNVGRQYSDRFHFEAGNTAIPEYNHNSGVHGVTLKIRDVNLKEIHSKYTNLEIVSKSTPTTKVNLLSVGDSMTNGNHYQRQVQEVLPNVQTVGTRTRDNGLVNGEGRGGWNLNQYFTQIGHATWGDSPFLFPVGVAGSKFWGNTSFWKRVCYDDPSGYDFDGFQKIATGWSGIDYLFDTNGYPKSPVVDDVVVDPTKASGSQWLKYDGSTWVVMSPQPTIEFSFSKYMERYTAAFGTNTPTHVSILLGANDFQMTDGIDAGIEDFISKLKTFIQSVKAYNSNIKFIVCLPIVGNTQDVWAVNRGTYGSAEMYRQNMQKLGRRILNEWDNDTQLNNGIYVCAMNIGVDVGDLSDWVHPNLDTGYKIMGNTLAALIQKIR
jgi:hypothetical protein